MRGVPVAVCLAVAAVLLPFSASAQVYRCKDTAGKTIYADAPCPTGQTGYLMEPAKTPENILEERLQAAQANERKYRAQAAEQEAHIRTAEILPTAQNPSTFTSIPTSHACERAKKEVAFISGMRTLSADEQRLRFNAAIVRSNIDCGTQTELIQEPVQKYVHQHSVPITTPRRPPPPPPPHNTQCQFLGCEDKPSGSFQRAR